MRSLIIKLLLCSTVKNDLVLTIPMLLPNYALGSLGERVRKQRFVGNIIKISSSIRIPRTGGSSASISASLLPAQLSSMAWWPAKCFDTREEAWRYHSVNSSNRLRLTRTHARTYTQDRCLSLFFFFAAQGSGENRVQSGVDLRSVLVPTSPESPPEKDRLQN